MSAETAQDQRRCVRAADRLPRRLLKQVQKYCQGLVWVPVLERTRRKTAANVERDRNILEERRGGRRIREIAARYFLTPTRVRQILKATG